MKIENKEKLRSILCMAACMLFYLFFCFRYGVVLGSDSRGYMEMISAREPVYPLLLALFRLIFGREHYLLPVIIFQNMLAAFAAWFSCERLWKRFAHSYLTLAGMYATHVMVAVLCCYVAERGAVYSSMIMTEGISLSLWLIAITLIIEAVPDWNVKKLVFLFFFLAVLMDVRKQMAVAYLVLASAVFFGRFGRDKGKQYFKHLLIVAAGIVLSVLLALLGTRLYNYALRGSFAQNTRDMNLVLTTSLYVADKEDSSLIEEESVRELFIKTLDILEESESNYRFAPKSLSGLEEHYEDHYDVITVDTTGPLFIEYAMEQGFAEGMEAEAEADRMSGVIVRSLFTDNIASYAKVYLASFLNGVANTIAKRGGLTAVYAIAALICEILLAAVLMRKEESRDAAMAAFIVLMAVLLNVAVAAALIFCQSRYMIYNMALFYMAGLWLLDRGYYEICKRHTA